MPFMMRTVSTRHNRIHRTIPFRPSIYKPNDYTYHAQCGFNTIGAYLNRHKPQRLPEYDPSLFANDRILRDIIRKPTKWTHEQYIDSMDRPEKRRVYTEASRMVRDEGRVISRITPFTKLEKVKTDKYRAPRLIHSRHATFNIEYGSYIKPLERSLKPDKHFGKGTYDQIAAKIAGLASKYKYYTAGDHSSFDAHNLREHLQLCHRFYAKCYDNDKYLRKLSRRTLRNKCSTRHGESYILDGGRMSGDVDTGFGNCIVNLYILRSVLSDLGYKGDAIVNGDDFILFSTARIDIARFGERLRSYNMECKLVDSATNISTVEFCRTKLVYHPDGHPTMAFDPDRLKAIYGCTFHRYSDSNYLRYLQNVQHANWSINQNSPVHRQWRPLDRPRVSILEKDRLHVLKKQSTNRPYTWDYLTPSFIEAYPNYQIDKPLVPIYKQPPDQCAFYIFNHMSKLVTYI
uniref:RNA-directed RNA polymerase n=1 Tax=Hypsignathus monstrosus tombus-like virus 1 TaxID=2499252 RepID=A0A3S9W0L7_9TOMB|nr:hypothetical protein 1 [Hypsignathus monstrosus tombus-like virus 1]